MTVLCYHAVDPDWQASLAVTPEGFAEQCEWLSLRRTVVDLPDAVARMNRRGRLPRGTAALTFDDGFDGVFDHAFPVLRRLRLPATVFLVAETLTPRGRPVDWVDTPPPRPIATLSREQVLEMQEGGIRFGSHSFSHRDLTTLSEEECERDLRSSRELLEDLLGRPVPYLAYPRGRHDEAVRRTAKRAGFTHAFALPETAERPGPYAIPRVGIYAGNGVNTLRVKASPWYLSARLSPVFPLARRMVSGGKAPARHPG